MKRAAKRALITIAVVVATSIAVLARTLRYGFSARDEPSALEAMAARVVRRSAVPADLRDRRNPVPLTPEAVEEGRAHFADHCASCHGNDGKGQTEMGRGMYPRAPDMTLPGTQSQSDGALFATIENGIRLTGMPAWGDGTAESALASWHLVHFIRRLPRLSADELAAMERQNPRSAAEWEALRAEDSFLSGGEGAGSDAPVESHRHR